MATDANKAIADSKAALKNAENFGQRETGNKKAGDSKPAASAKPASPSYSAARAARSTGIQSEAESAAAGLKAKADNVAQYETSNQ
jgi:hypothetical protein